MKLRRKTGANPGNAGVRPGATSLVFRRGVCIEADAPLQAQSAKRAPSSRARFGAGRGRGERGQVVCSTAAGQVLFFEALTSLDCISD
jgi:hypothetical protein